jgi:hypothetical protein
MERMRSADPPRAIEAVRDDIGRRLAAETGMLVFLIGLALLFVANAPS